MIKRKGRYFSLFAFISLPSPLSACLSVHVSVTRPRVKVAVFEEKVPAVQKPWFSKLLYEESGLVPL